MEVSRVSKDVGGALRICWLLGTWYVLLEPMKVLFSRKLLFTDKNNERQDVLLTP